MPGGGRDLSRRDRPGGRDRRLTSRARMPPVTGSRNRRARGLRARARLVRPRRPSLAQRRHPGGRAALGSARDSRSASTCRTRCERGCPVPGRARRLGCRSSLRTAEPDVIAAGGVRWLNLEHPREADRDWLEEQFDFHPLDYEDVYSRNQRPKLDAVRRLRLHRVCTSPCSTRSSARAPDGGDGPLRGPGLPDHAPNQPLPPLTAMFERYREKGRAARGHLLEGLRATCSTRSWTPPWTRPSRCCARWARSSSASRTTSSRGRVGQIVRDISEVKQEIINFRKIVRPQRAVLRDLERTKQRYLPGRAGDLLRRHLRRRRADLGHPRELQGSRRGSRVHRTSRSCPIA